MSLKPASRAAYNLLHEGSLTAARIEAAGLRIDTAYLDKAIADVTRQVAEMEQEIREHEIVKLWRKQYGTQMKLGSRVQLGHIVFKVMGYKRNPFLDPGTNEEVAFKHLTKKLPFLAPDGPYFGIAKLKKALSTNLLGFKKEVVDGFIHPFINMHTTESYRPSSDRPNLFNQPRRNKKIAEIVRSAVIPRSKDHVLIECDYSSQEVRCAACYCKDPVLIEYVTGGGDQHYDAAKDLYMLTDEEIGPIDKGCPGRDVRDIAKNKYVFPQNYGSYYRLCAPDLWEWIGELDLKTAQGVSLYQHLRSKGIKKLGACDSNKEPVKGTFEYHVKEAEQKYWERLAVYWQWRKDWWDLYLRQGGVNTLTGFVQYGVFRRNQILCDSIQGSAWHCLLWSMIQIQKEMLRRKMKTKIVNCIYDALMFDAPKTEMPDVIELMKKYAVTEVAKHYKWLTVPLAVDFEASAENWYKKEKVKL